MALIESRITGAIEFPLKEREYKREGVILVLAHRERFSGDLSVCMVRHNSNPLKGIESGMLGFPSETIEQSKAETSEQALIRCFEEELGIFQEEDFKQSQFYRTTEDNNFSHVFNLDTGLNGDSSNARGHGTVIWTPRRDRIIARFQQAYSRGVIDQGELSGICFVPIEEISDSQSGLRFRKAPDPTRIIRDLTTQGKLDHPML